MNLNEVDIYYLTAATCVITSTLVFYTIGVWGERLQKRPKFWYLVFFLLGLLVDSMRAALMENTARLTHLYDEIHTVTGIIAILLMFVHAMWAIWTCVKGSEKAKEHFNHFSIVVWCVWLVPYCIGVYLGMSLHH